MIARADTDGPRIGITGIGAAVPEKIVTNDDLAEYVDTNDAWIAERTGIRERRVTENGVGASQLALPAARDALAAAGGDPSSLDLVIVATITPDMPFPATASFLADALGAGEVPAYDLQAGCSGFVYALTQAYGSVSAGLADRVLVVGVDLLTKYLDWDDRGTCILFGDGAGAAIVERVEQGGFLGFELGNDGSHADDLYVPAGGTRAPASVETVNEKQHTMKMNGREVFRFATRIMVTSAERVLTAADMTPDDVDVYAPHQANKRIIDHAVKQLGLDPEKVILNVDRYGNTSAASIPLCLHESLQDGSLKPGTRLLMTAVGTGITWGSALMEWTYGVNDAATNGAP